MSTRTQSEVLLCLDDLVGADHSYRLLDTLFDYKGLWTPDHSYFGTFRKRLGTQGLMDIFRKIRDGLKAQGLVREVFAFVDASLSLFPSYPPGPIGIRR